MTAVITSTEAILAIAKESKAPVTSGSASVTSAAPGSYPATGTVDYGDGMVYTTAAAVGNTATAATVGPANITTQLQQQIRPARREQERRANKQDQYVQTLLELV